MKILIYSKVFFPSLGGLQRNTYTLANTLQTLGHAVTVFTETLESSDTTFAFQLVRSSSVLTLNKSVNEADLVFINGGVSIKVAVICWGNNKKFNFIYQTADGIYINSGLKKLLLTPVRRILARKAVWNIVQTKSSIANIGPGASNVLVLINPVDPEIAAFADNHSEKKYDFLFAGRIIKEKGIYVLLEAVEIIKKRGFSVSVAIAGDGHELKNVLALIKEKELPVTYLGSVDKKELANAYLVSSMLIVPSSGHMEGSPLVISEAISLNTPVIVSDQPAMVEATGKSGLTFKSGQVEELADLMTTVVTKKEVYERLLKSCKEEAEKFSPSHYKKILKEQVLPLSL
jgi:glycosyltransferase involved in cell wall biosynthesis